MCTPDTQVCVLGRSRPVLVHDSHFITPAPNSPSECDHIISVKLCACVFVMSSTSGVLVNFVSRAYLWLLSLCQCACLLSYLPPALSSSAKIWTSYSLHGKDSKGEEIYRYSIYLYIDIHSFTYICGVTTCNP